VEQSVINRVEGLTGSLTHGIAELAVRLERSVFHTGVHVGVPQASGRVGRFLNATEEMLDRPLVSGGLVFVSFAVVLLMDML
jgi:hypothetical protein